MALIQGQGPLEGVQYAHTWLEADGQVINLNGHETVMRTAYDWASGNSTVMPAELFRYVAKAESVYEYTPAQAFKEMEKTGIYGPWSEEIKAHDDARIAAGVTQNAPRSILDQGFGYGDESGEMGWGNN